MPKKVLCVFNFVPFPCAHWDSLDSLPLWTYGSNSCNKASISSAMPYLFSQSPGSTMLKKGMKVQQTTFIYMPQYAHHITYSIWDSLGPVPRPAPSVIQQDCISRASNGRKWHHSGVLIRHLKVFYPTRRLQVLLQINQLSHPWTVKLHSLWAQMRCATW